MKDQEVLCRAAAGFVICALGFMVLFGVHP
jgi:hypothetical protein